jgi:hypothetical protein
MRSTIWGVVLAIGLGVAAGVVIGHSGDKKNDTALNARAVSTSTTDTIDTTSTTFVDTLPTDTIVDPAAVAAAGSVSNFSPRSHSIKTVKKKSSGGGGGGGGGGGTTGTAKKSTTTTAKANTGGTTTTAKATTSTTSNGVTTTTDPKRRYCGPGPTTSIPAKNYPQVCGKPAPTTSTTK